MFLRDPSRLLWQKVIIIESKVVKLLNTNQAHKQQTAHTLYARQRANRIVLVRENGLHEPLKLRFQ